LLGAIDSDFKAAIFSGTSNEIEIETSEVELYPGFRSVIEGVRPIVDAAATVSIKTRERLADNPTATDYASMQTDGLNPLRTSGRYIRANVKVASGTTFTNAQGVDFISSQGSQR